MFKHCQFCGRYFRPDPRVGSRQKACRREVCRKARKFLAQHQWTERNPGYFRGRYPYVKQWRATRKNTSRPMIQDEITLKKPLFRMIFLIPGGLRRAMIQAAGVRLHGRLRDGQAGDDAGQFKGLTDSLQLCWVHVARHFKDLDPVTPDFRRISELRRREGFGHFTRSYGNLPQKQCQLLGLSEGSGS